MKNSVKISALFIFLGLLLSSLIGCNKTATNTQSNTETGQSNTNTTVVNSTNSGSTTATKSEYPPVAQAIMQADLKSLDGTTFKLEDYKGKVVVVNFWATWCGPCKAEMPDLVKLREANKEKGFEIIGVNADPGDDAAAIKEFGEKMKLTYKLAQAEEDFFEQFLKISKFSGIPQSFLIDREGRLNGVYLGGGKKTLAQLEENLNKLMSVN